MGTKFLIMKHITFLGRLFCCVIILFLPCSASAAVDDPEEERIFFIRKRNVSGLRLGDIFSMKSDGSDVQRITHLSDNYSVTELPQISRDGKTLAFISNFESWKSAFYADAFVFDLQKGLLKRVTGFEQKTPAVDFGTVTVTVEDPKFWASSPSAIRISYKGCNNFVTGNSAVLTVPANEDIWVKAELAKAKGDLKVVRVETGGNAELKLNLEAGSLTAEHVFPSNDGSFLVVATNTESVSFPFYAIALWGTNEREMLVEVKGQKLGGDTYPAISPDGSMLAFCTGQHTLNSLAIVPMDNLEATPTILVPGTNLGIQAYCAQPTWSPDGSEIVFVYTTIATSLLGTEIQSNLYKVSVYGGDPVQLTSFSGQEVVSRPSFSPDGNSIAFSLLRSFGTVFLLSDIINNNYSSDIYAIPVEQAAIKKGKATPVALTNDGNSLDPSWGYLNTSVGISERQDAVESFHLYQNYPNPFHAVTNIEYEIQGLSHLRVEVYDLLGQSLAVLVDGTYPAGHYKCSWQGKDLYGNFVPNGIYIYRISNEGRSFSRRMVLQR